MEIGTAGFGLSYRLGFTSLIGFASPGNQTVAGKIIQNQAWFSLPGLIIRLDGGTKIILIHRVLNTALSIFHILLFFIAGTGSIFLLVNGNDFSYRSWPSKKVS